MTMIVEDDQIFWDITKFIIIVLCTLLCCKVNLRYSILLFQIFIANLNSAQSSNSKRITNAMAFIDHVFDL